jgi:hypothetical protein
VQEPNMGPHPAPEIAARRGRWSRRPHQRFCVQWPKQLIDLVSRQFPGAVIESHSHHGDEPSSWKPASWHASPSSCATIRARKCSWLVRSDRGRLPRIATALRDPWRTSCSLR